jgi:MFS family permease
VAGAVEQIPEAGGIPGPPQFPSRRTLRGLDWLNFLLADVQTGVGPFLAIYLAGYKWNEERVGLALTVGGIAGILTQTPAGALVDFLRSKRALVGLGVAALAAGALLIALFPSFWPVMGAQVLFLHARDAHHTIGKRVTATARVVATTLILARSLSLAR